MLTNTAGNMGDVKFRIVSEVLKAGVWCIHKNVV